MKKIITTFLALALLAGCSSSTAKTTTSKNTKAKETASATPTSTPTEDPAEKMKNDGVLDYSNDAFSLKLDGTELAQDDEGQNLLVNKFTFVNKTSGTTTFFNVGYIRYFQNGVEVRHGSYTLDGSSPYVNQPDSQTEIMAGATAQLQDIVVLSDTTDPVTLVLEDSNGTQLDSETVNLQ